MRLGSVVAAVLASIALTTPAWAGQVNLLARTTTISETIVTSNSGSFVQTISGSGSVSMANTRLTNTSVTRNVTISETFSSTSATVSFELAQDGVNYSSPFNNIFAVGTLTQVVTVQTTSGLSVIQVTAGAGNVSVASSSVLDGTALNSIYASTAGSGTVGATSTLALALTPGFALQNSNVNALVLAATNAVANSAFQLPGGAVTAIDVEQTNLNEYSPHGNIANPGFARHTQSVGVLDTSGLTVVQVQGGAGNVQAAHSVVLVNSSLVTGSIVINPGS